MSTKQVAEFMNKSGQPIADSLLNIKYNKEAWMFRLSLLQEEVKELEANDDTSLTARSDLTRRLDTLQHNIDTIKQELDKKANKKGR